MERKCGYCRWYSPLMWLDDGVDREDDEQVGECTIEITPVTDEDHKRYDGYPVCHPSHGACMRFEPRRER